MCDRYSGIDYTIGFWNWSDDVVLFFFFLPQFNGTSQSAVKLLLHLQYNQSCSVANIKSPVHPLSKTSKTTSNYKA